MRQILQHFGSIETRADQQESFLALLSRSDLSKESAKVPAGCDVFPYLLEPAANSRLISPLQILYDRQLQWTVANTNTRRPPWRLLPHLPAQHT